MRLGFVRVVAAIILVVGCTESSGPRQPQEVGNYVLAAINGNLLPAVVIDNPGFRGEVVSGIIFVMSDGSYRELRSSRITTPSGVSTVQSEMNGTYSISGTAMVFTIPASQTSPAVTYSAQLNSTILTINVDGSAYRYEKVLLD